MQAWKPLRGRGGFDLVDETARETLSPPPSPEKEEAARG
jgi:hypothetical protein